MRTGFERTNQSSADQRTTNAAPKEKKKVSRNRWVRWDSRTNYPVIPFLSRSHLFLSIPTFPYSFPSVQSYYLFCILRVYQCYRTGHNLKLVCEFHELEILYHTIILVRFYESDAKIIYELGTSYTSAKVG